MDMTSFIKRNTKEGKVQSGDDEFNVRCIYRLCGNYETSQMTISGRQLDI